MNDKEIWHRHLGAYGICYEDGKLLVIRKKGGPYTGRYDLPGGSLEPVVAILYEVAYAGGDVADSPNFDDSDGAEWIAIESLLEEEASPLVRDAVHWIRTGQLPLEAA